MVTQLCVYLVLVALVLTVVQSSHIPRSQMRERNLDKRLTRSIDLSAFIATGYLGECMTPNALPEIR